MLMFAAQLPLEPVDDAFDAGLKNVGGNTDGSPPFGTVRKNRQHSNQSGRTFLFVVLRCAVQQTHVELFKMNFGKLRVVLFKNLA